MADNLKTITGEYSIDNENYLITTNSNIATGEVEYIEIKQDDNITKYEKGNDYFDYNGEKYYFTVEEETSVSFERSGIMTNNYIPITTTSIVWMPIYTTWYTYHLNDYIGVTPVSVIISAVLIFFSGPYASAVSVASVIQLYHNQVYAVQYKKDWKCKKVYCGAQGYYGKYANKWYHYDILGNYIPGTYYLQEIL
jgi:hypothetical protein